MASPVAALFRLEQCEEPRQYLPVSSDLAAFVSGREDQELHDAFVVFINEVIFRRLTPPGSEPPRISRLVEVPSMLEQRIDRWIMKQQEVGWQKGRQDGLREGQKKGLREGQKKGLREGRKKGLREGEAGLLMRQLERKHGPLPAWVNERVSSAGAEQLLVWADRILTAANLDEIFED